MAKIAARRRRGWWWLLQAASFPLRANYSRINYTRWKHKLVNYGKVGARRWWKKDVIFQWFCHEEWWLAIDEYWCLDDRVLQGHHKYCANDKREQKPDQYWLQAMLSESERQWMRFQEHQCSHLTPHGGHGRRPSRIRISSFAVSLPEAR